MSRLTEQDIEAIARRIAADLQSGTPVAGPEPTPAPVARDLGIFATVDEAVQAAREAQPTFVALPLKVRVKIIESIRRTMLEGNEALARAAHQETGLGRVEDKVVKNRLVTEKTPGLEELYPQSVTGDHGLTLVEPAPFGVIGAITPSTNPTSTIICNAIGMLAAGNSVVFNAHPGARNCSMQAVALLNTAIISAGGPRNVVTCLAEPTIETAQQLMRHPSVRLLVVTGGGAVVQGGDGLRQARDLRRPGKPAGGRGRECQHRQGRPRHRAGRLHRQQHHLHRRKRGHLRCDGRRRADQGHDASRRGC